MNGDLAYLNRCNGESVRYYQRQYLELYRKLYKKNPELFTTGKYGELVRLLHQLNPFKQNHKSDIAPRVSKIGRAALRERIKAVRGGHELIIDMTLFSEPEKQRSLFG